MLRIKKEIPLAKQIINTDKHKTGTYKGLKIMNGIGRQVKNTVIRRKNFRPHRSESPPIRGALRNDRKPLTPRTRPL